MRTIVLLLLCSALAVAQGFPKELGDWQQTSATKKGAVYAHAQRSAASMSADFKEGGSAESWIGEWDQLMGNSGLKIDKHDSGKVGAGSYSSYVYTRSTGQTILVERRVYPSGSRWLILDLYDEARFAPDARKSLDAAAKAMLK